MRERATGGGLPAAMAIEAQVPLVPAALAGTHRILEKGSIIIRPRPSALLIGEPISTTGLKSEDRERITDEAHAAVAQLLAQGNQLVTEMEE